ncbi:MAG: hypothetical protein AAB957_01205 [Patescibacteria group bacterium]
MTPERAKEIDDLVDQWNEKEKEKEKEEYPMIGEPLWELLNEWTLATDTMSVDKLIVFMHETRKNSSFWKSIGAVIKAAKELGISIEELLEWYRTDPRDLTKE